MVRAITVLATFRSSRNSCIGFLGNNIDIEFRHSARICVCVHAYVYVRVHIHIHTRTCARACIKTSSTRLMYLVLVVSWYGLLLGSVRSRTPTKQEKRTQQQSKRSYFVVGFFYRARVCVCTCTHTYTYAYAYTYTRELCLKSISILFPSNPIHELRLDLNVANTVIALTIRVI